MSQSSRPPIPMAFSTPPVLDRVKIYQTDGTRLAFDSVKYRAVAAPINLGLSMLESQPGRNWLKVIASNLLSIPSSSIQVIYEGTHDDATLLGWVDLFLRRLRTGFIDIHLDGELRGEGCVERRDWAVNGRTIQDWVPSVAGKMRINNKVIDDMITAAYHADNTRNQQRKEVETNAYQSMMFLLQVTIAHELVHLWVGFLTGHIRPLTPLQINWCPRLYAQRVDGKFVGESGRNFEGNVFEGTIEAFEDMFHPLGTRQARTLFLVTNFGLARAVDIASIRKNINQDWDFPFKTVGPSINIDWIIDNNTHMQDLRMGGPPSGSGSVGAHQVDGRNRGFGFGDPLQHDNTPADTIQGHQFQRICAIPRRPELLFARS